MSAAVGSATRNELAIDEVDRTTAEEKKDDDTDVDPMSDSKEDQNILEAVESADVEPEQQSAGGAILKKLWESMNPAMCLAPATACTHVLLDEEIVEYNNVVPPMLRDMKHAGKSRTTALQKLYRFTDKEHQKNRYVQSK